MPYAAHKPCSYPGCNNLVRFGRCEQHKSKLTYERDPERQGLYNTTAWQRIRQAQLANQPWCAVCLRTNIYTPAIDVDHITPHRGDPAKFYAGPFQSLCHACHSRKTAQEVGISPPPKNVLVGST
jgi:5-methylcytosine-specific restriction protein A